MSSLFMKKHISTIENYFKLYLQQKTPDCILYTEDGFMFNIHKEILSQTIFLRKILSSAKGVAFLDHEIWVL